MATAYPEPANQTIASELPVMRWGPVFAGWFVAMGIAVLLYAFGLAMGLSALDPWNTALVGRGISAGAIIWVILTWGAALWLGGMFSGWFDGRNDTEMGVVRGLTVWGLSVTATTLLVATGLAHHIMFVTTVAPALSTQTVDPSVMAHYTAAAMWTTFGCTVLSLITSAFGGWLGAHHVHHVYHLRTYAPHRRL
ncbi:MAG: hypothetical protein ACREPU_04460 [Rhodanobacteraceae bacterium]